MKSMKTMLILFAIVCISAGSASAMSKGWAVPLEVAGSYGAGIGVSMLAFGAVGGWHGGLDSVEGIIAVVLVYPAVTSLAVYGVGELAEGDSKNDALSLGVTMAASYATMAGCIALPVLGPFLGIILPPLVDTLAYNLVKEVEEDEVLPDEGTYTHLISFSVGF